LRGLTRLQYLGLCDSDEITDAGLAHVAALSELKQLNLGGKLLTDQGISQLAALTKLEYLVVHGPQLTDDCLPTVKTLTRLKAFVVFNTQLTKAGVDQLKADRPDIQVFPTLSADPEPQPVFRSFLLRRAEEQFQVRRLGIQIGIHSLIVRDVLLSSPAAKAGLQNDDLVISLNGVAVTNAVELADAVNRIRLGGRASLVLRRGAGNRTVDMTLDNF
jgi:hypothetical protein